jgi:hypothetical protein
MRLRLTIFGHEVWALELENAEEEVGPEIGGGSMHNYDRDLDPLDPTPGEEWYGDDRKFGFS